MTPFLDELEREIVAAARREERRTDRARRRTRALGVAGARLALAAALVALVLVALGPLSAQNDRETAGPAASLDGTYASRFTFGADFSRERLTPLRSMLTVRDRRFTLTTDTLGLQGAVEVGDGTVTFRSDGPYFRRPGFASGSQPIPDAAGRCAGVPRRYRWARAQGRIRFLLVAAPCGPRAAQLTSRPWDAAR